MEKNISEEEIKSILTQDTYYRKIGTWPLVTTKKIVGNSVNKITTDYFMVSKTYQGDELLTNCDLGTFTKNLNDKHPFTTELLTKFNGHIVACGGSIAKNLISNNDRIVAHPDIEDVDIFFHSIDTDTASKLRIEIIEFLVNKWRNRDNKEKGKFKIVVLRNEFVTTIYFAFKEDDYYMKTYSYQLIHRIYPNISSIIGGFDLSVCMIAYDGNELYATPLGAWALKNHTVIIDTKRRSTSFEYRICKYYDYGFNILFPGLTQELVDTLVLDPCRSTTCDENELIQKIHNLAIEHKYNIHHFIMSKNHSDDVLFLDQQKQEDILPFLNINDGYNEWRRDDNDMDGELEFQSYQKVKIGILPYNMKNIENRYITKISDYSHNSINLTYMPDMNATKLRLDNLASVVSVLKIKKDCPNINGILTHESDNPDLKFTICEIENFISRTQEVRNHYGSDFNYYKSRDIEITKVEHLIRKDTKRLSKCFGKLALEVKDIRNTNQYDNYVKMMIEKMIVNERKCRDNLTGIKWITQNPGRQWTSSINPIIANPREWYGKHYIPVLTGIPEEIETCLRLIRLERTNSIWTILNDDIFNLLLKYIIKSYADDAWKYIEEKHDKLVSAIPYDNEKQLYLTVDDNFIVKIIENEYHVMGRLVNDEIVSLTDKERKNCETVGYII